MRKLSLVVISLTLLFGLSVSFAGWRAQAAGAFSAPLMPVFKLGVFNHRVAPTTAQPPNCPTAATLTQSASQVINDFGNTGTCSAGGNEHFDNSFWRAFNLPAMGVSSSFNVSQVQIGVRHAASSGGTQPITVRIHQQTSGTFPAGSWTQLSATNYNLPNAAAGTVLSIPITPPTVVPAGAVMIIEIFTPSGWGLGNTFRIGSNFSGESAPSYHSSPTCNRPIETINAHLVMNVLGSPNAAPSVGHYPNTWVTLGGSTTVKPSALPVDESGIDNITIGVTPNFFNGIITADPTTGAVMINNANPPGYYQFFVNINDKCGASTQRQFLLTVDPCAATFSKSGQNFSAQGGMGSFNVAISSNCTWSAVSDDPSFITVTAPAGNITGNGTVSFTINANNNATARGGTITVAGQTFIVRQGAQFADVPVGAQFYEEIGKLSAAGITQGCGGGNYCPDSNVSRDQMAAFIIRALGLPNPPTPAVQRFADVLPGSTFYAFTEEMAVRQITLGCGGGNYCPSDPVSRQAMAAFLIRAVNLPGYMPPTDVPQRFADVPSSNSFYGHIEEMAVRMITLGCGGGNYCPTDNVTRRQMAAFLVRAFGL